MQDDQASPTDTMSLTPSVITSSKYKFSGQVAFLLVISALLIISIIGNILQYLNFGFLQNTGLPNNTIKIPIDIKKPFLKSYGMSYYVETKITGIKEGSSGTEIITDVNDKEFPKIYIQPRTILYTDIDGDKFYDSINKNQLKVGQKIGIYMIYSQLNNWMIVRITILPK